MTANKNNNGGLRGDTREILREITQQTRANLIQDLLGHPHGSPSKKELDYMNPSKTSTTISEHLNRLIELGFVERVKLPEGERKRDLPHTFYRLTDPGREFLEEHSILVDEEEQIEREYENVDKEPDIKAAEEAPRPTR